MMLLNPVPNASFQSQEIDDDPFIKELIGKLLEDRPDEESLILEESNSIESPYNDLNSKNLLQEHNKIENVFRTFPMQNSTSKFIILEGNKNVGHPTELEVLQDDFNRNGHDVQTNSFITPQNVNSMHESESARKLDDSDFKWNDCTYTQKIFNGTRESQDYAEKEEVILQKNYLQTSFRTSINPQYETYISYKIREENLMKNKLGEDVNNQITNSTENLNKLSIKINMHVQKCFEQVFHIKKEREAVESQLYKITGVFISSSKIGIDKKSQSQIVKRIDILLYAVLQELHKVSNIISKAENLASTTIEFSDIKLPMPLAVHNIITEWMQSLQTVQKHRENIDKFMDHSKQKIIDIEGFNCTSIYVKSLKQLHITLRSMRTFLWYIVHVTLSASHRLHTDTSDEIREKPVHDPKTSGY